MSDSKAGDHPDDEVWCEHTTSRALKVCVRCWLQRMRDMEAMEMFKRVMKTLNEEEMLKRVMKTLNEEEMWLNKMIVKGVWGTRNRLEYLKEIQAMLKDLK